MTATLHHFPAAEAANDSPQWGQGEAFCLACDHSWQAVAQTGKESLEGFECPSCHRHTGHWKFEFYPTEGTEVRTCDCANQLFYLTRQGHMCANCGIYQRYD